MHYQLAQINVAHMLGENIDSPIMQEFVANLDRINSIAEASQGFIWRYVDADSNDATSANPFNDEKIIINISVWEDIESLKKFVYQSAHLEFLQRKKEWFTKFKSNHLAMWWIPAGEFPSVDEAVAKLNELQTEGASERVFDFRKPFPKPTT